MTKKKPPHKTRTAARRATAPTNGKAAAPALLPPTQAGYFRVPLYPIWWAEEGELHGALVDLETTVDTNGKRADALVIVTELPTRGVDNWGDRFEIEKGEPVRISVSKYPELMKVIPFATDGEKVAPCVVHVLNDRGRMRFVVDVVLEGVPRDQFKPKVDATAPEQTTAPAS